MIQNFNWNWNWKTTTEITLNSSNQQDEMLQKVPAKRVVRVMPVWMLCYGVVCRSRTWRRVRSSCCNKLTSSAVDVSCRPPTSSRATRNWTWRSSPTCSTITRAWSRATTSWRRCATRPERKRVSGDKSKVNQYCYYKSSAVAEMGDRGHNRHGPKRGGLLCPFHISMLPGPRPTTMPSAIFIHPVVLPQ